ncbi:component of SufBCD complex [Falsihalocynthiibacter sp. SS001]|uniref:component of SufBCD complex n=1 Tax=Falsihalocynthiibacter sp. SS001 TaxID=3349698 RepID=UPI0036D3354C
MDLYENIFELIDMRSFSNLWYWIGLAVLWSSASHWVLGVPVDLIHRARRLEGETMQDLQDLVRINCNRIHYIIEMSGLWLLGFVSFILTTLAILGGFYNVEFAQAVFLLFAPMAVVGSLSLALARDVTKKQPTGQMLCKRLLRHRIYIQLIGVVSIFVTAMWGMYQNMNFSALFG